MNNSSNLPLVISLTTTSLEAFISYYLENSVTIEQQLTQNGVIKFEHIPIESVNDFQKVVEAISDKFLSYVDGNSPRTKLSGNVYTSTEYDSSQKITMHNELSYSSKWPNKLFFSCIVPSMSGGETLLADSRRILNQMHPEITEEIKAKGVTYIRNLHGGTGMGPSWQETFEESEKAAVECHCRSLNIDFQWLDLNILRLKQTAPGIIRHRKTDELVWFNQIDQFHPAQLGDEFYQILSSIYESPKEYPMNVEFGDGSLISEDIVREILKTIERLTVAPQWNKHELLIIDNEMISHGRNPFTGDRKVLVSMSK